MLFKTAKERIQFTVKEKTVFRSRDIGIQWKTNPKGISTTATPENRNTSSAQQA